MFGSTLIFGASPKENWSAGLVCFSEASVSFGFTGSVLPNEKVCDFPLVLSALEGIVLLGRLGMLKGSGFWKVKLKLLFLLLSFPNIWAAGCGFDSGCLSSAGLTGDFSAVTACLNDDEMTGLYWLEPFAFVFVVLLAPSVVLEDSFSTDILVVVCGCDDELRLNDGWGSVILLLVDFAGVLGGCDEDVSDGLVLRTLATCDAYGFAIDEATDTFVVCAFLVLSPSSIDIRADAVLLSFLGC